jgi:hypothetical protein
VPAYVNAVNTLWTLVAAFLVFFMQAGFMFLEAGLARTRETVNVLLESLDIHEHGGPAYPELLSSMSGYDLPEPKRMAEPIALAAPLPASEGS